jgi:hypothetical protein
MNRGTFTKTDISQMPLFVLPKLALAIFSIFLALPKQALVTFQYFELYLNRH